jgi:glutathione S-transferase
VCSLPKLFGNLERSIKGPFYFGESPTYVDFMLAAQLSWVRATLFDRLKDECGVDLFSSFQKIAGVEAGILALPGVATMELVVARDNFKEKDEFFAAYKAL